MWEEDRRPAEGPDQETSANTEAEDKLKTRKRQLELLLLLLRVFFFIFFFASSSYRLHLLLRVFFLLSSLSCPPLLLLGVLQLF